MFLTGSQININNKRNIRKAEYIGPTMDIIWSAWPSTGSVLGSLPGPLLMRLDAIWCNQAELSGLILRKQPIFLPTTLN